MAGIMIIFTSYMYSYFFQHMFLITSELYNFSLSIQLHGN